MSQSEYSKIIQEIEKANFYSYKDRIEISKAIAQIATDSNSKIANNGKLLKILIALQIMSISLTSPVLAQLLKALLI